MILVECDVCNTKVPKDKSIFDKGVNYPDIAKKKHEEQDVKLCYDCNQKLNQKDVPNPEN